MVAKDVGKELKALRIRHGYTLQDVQNAIKIHKKPKTP